MDLGFVKNFVDEITGRFETTDVFELAGRAGVKIVYESWHPVTIGEFERNTKTIRVNLRALENKTDSADLKEIIVAHELGHFFAIDLKLTELEEERFAHAFAENLIGNKN